MDRIENRAYNNPSIVACVFIAMVTFLPSRCLTTIEGYTYRHTRLVGFMHYAAEMGSGFMIFVPSFTQIVSGIHNLIWEIYRHKDSVVIS
jgi:hypothetical protein